MDFFIRLFYILLLIYVYIFLEVDEDNIINYMKPIKERSIKFLE